MAEVAMLFEDIGGDERVRVESRGEARLAAEALIVDVEGFEGPLDVLLTLSRTQKVDLRKISVLHLAQQYLDFIEHAKVLRIELAADYLVMAAWLAFLKSRLLLPQDPDEELSGEEMAAHLAFRLERLRAMRDAASRLMARDRLGTRADRAAPGATATTGRSRLAANGRPAPASSARVAKRSPRPAPAARPRASAKLAASAPARNPNPATIIGSRSIASPDGRLASRASAPGARPSKWRRGSARHPGGRASRTAGPRFPMSRR